MGKADSKSDARVALVTGANRGIGLEVCRQLATSGLRVILTGRDAKRARDAAAALSKEGLDVPEAVVDVADAGRGAALRKYIDEAFGGVDVLVNNAAVLVDEDRGVLTTLIDDLRSTLETNVVGALSMCQALVPGMMRRKYGRVVNVSSTAGQLASMATYAPAYSISK